MDLCFHLSWVRTLRSGSFLCLLKNFFSRLGLPGGNIILACRDMEKCEAAAKEIRRETLNHRVNARHLDLASLKSIREFAAKVAEGRRAAAGLVREGLRGWAVRRGRTRRVLELSVGHWLFLFSLWVQILHFFSF